MNGCIPTLYNLWSMPSGLGFGPKRASEITGSIFCNFWCVASVTRPRGSRGRVIRSFSLPRGRVSHVSALYAFYLRRAVASVMRPRCCFFASGTRSRRPCDRVIPVSAKFRFALSFHFCMFPFPSFKSFYLRKSETNYTLITASNENEGN